VKGAPITGLESTAPALVRWPQKHMRLQRISIAGVRLIRRPAEPHARMVALASTRPT
jgi:hypothetical protein